ncbi:response regulator [Lysobacter soli]|uniref:Response regulator n=1 Tax=Lysobacter soli TaxID=453783 RepID=A0A3D8VDU5_9GAMM|nr:response regulator [Lysobacter soli]RDY67577.1 response regulator [Lysobacter soli]
MELRVLIVEDEFLIASMLEAHLVRLGYTVPPIAATVEEALSILEQNEIHLAVVDINLAGTASYPVADALKARSIPFVFTTGYGQSGLPEPYRAFPIVQKPYRISRLEPILRGLLPEVSTP